MTPGDVRQIGLTQLTRLVGSGHVISSAEAITHLTGSVAAGRQTA